MADAAVVVVGGGLAGLAAALSAVEAGASSVTLLEKEGKLGGNSVKASFGINAVGEGGGDTAEAFVEDVYAAGGQSADRALVTALAERSLEALSWLKTFGLPLDEVVQGAGSRAPRVRKVLGFQLVLALSRQLEELANEGKVSILKGAKVVELVTGAVGVHGVKYEKDGVQSEALGAVVLSSGGSAAEPTLLPADLRALPGTQGPFTQGEGQRLAAVAGASLVDADKFQVHPTAFVDPNDKEAKSRILASEWLRQAGGVLIDGAGDRFCNECADTARDIAGKLAGRALPIRLVLPPKTVEAEGKHLGFYKSKGLLAEHANPAALAQALGLVEADLAAALGEPFAGGPLLCGEVAQAVHYSLGGVRIDSSSRAMGDAGPVPGLFAAGEVAGGIHGLNRLAGNGLLESVVFGRSAGRAAVELGVAP